jgi:DNA-directed RNA polymerase subunit RPC12/RpoP
VMQIQNQKMEDFMTDWGPLFFQEAQKVMVPYYDPESESSTKWDRLVEAIQKHREPFPDQATAVAALAAHLYGRDKKGAFLCADMGTGKTLMSALAAALASFLGRPRRTIVVVPPHMVNKWSRELENTLPGIRVVNINGSHAISVLQKEVMANPKQPKTPEFWVVGRVRARMGYRRRSGLQRLTPRILDLGRVTADHVCPDCGHKVVVRLTEKKAEQMKEEQGHRIRRMGDDETGEDLQYIWFPNAPYFAAGRRTCEWVYENGEVYAGCGAALWQATRGDKQDTRALQEKALANLEGMGVASAKKVMESGEGKKILAYLESGIVPDALIRIIGRAAAARVQKQLDAHGFFSADADYAVAEFIKRKVPKGWFHLAIFDEVHELDGDNTAQGIAMGIIASQVEKTIALTGTLIDGYAGSLFPLLFRMYPEQMLAAGYTAHDAALFQQEMGIIKEISEEEEEDTGKFQYWVEASNITLEAERPPGQGHRRKSSRLQLRSVTGQHHRRPSIEAWRTAAVLLFTRNLAIALLI